MYTLPVPGKWLGPLSAPTVRLILRTLIIICIQSSDTSRGLHCDGSFARQMGNRREWGQGGRCRGGEALSRLTVISALAEVRHYGCSDIDNHNGRLVSLRSDHIRALRALHQKKKGSVPLKRPCAAYYEIVSQALRASLCGKYG